MPAPLTSLDPMALVDIDRYPIGDPEAVAATPRQELRDTGVSILPGFLTPEAVDALVAEADLLAPTAFHQDVQGTPYLERPADSWPSDHPRTTWSKSSVHTIGYDQLPPDSLLRGLYESDDLLDVVAAVLDRQPLYRYADPMGGLNLAVMSDADELGWHYDQTDFVVSIALQSSERGGDFESVEQLRGRDGDEHYDVVARVLSGDAPELVTTVPMTPGTLMLFEGRWSLHRVTPIGGNRPRYVGLLAYDTKPGTVSTEALRRTRYGRAEPVPTPAPLYSKRP